MVLKSIFLFSTWKQVLYRPSLLIYPTEQKYYPDHSRCNGHVKREREQGGREGERKTRRQGGGRQGVKEGGREAGR